MKTSIRAASIGALMLLTFALPALAEDHRAKLDEHIRTITGKFEAMQKVEKSRIPRETLERAHAILLLDRTKAGFVFAYQGGLGVALVKDSKSGQWSAPAFVKADEGSLGFQVGVQKSFVVALFMSADAAKRLAESQMVLGGEARGTAGDETAGTEAGTDQDPSAVRVFYSREGVYGGAAVKGGSIGPDESANRCYYERTITNREILFEKKVKPTKAAEELAAAIQAQAKVANKTRD